MKRPDIPASLLNMKDDGPEEEEEEEEDEDITAAETEAASQEAQNQKDTAAQRQVKQENLPATSYAHSSKEMDSTDESKLFPPFKLFEA